MTGQTYNDGTYPWVQLTYGGQTGWARLQDTNTGASPALYDDTLNFTCIQLSAGSVWVHTTPSYIYLPSQAAALTISSVTPTTLQTLGQDQSATYTVTVHDGSGNPVNGASVLISDDVEGTCPSPLPSPIAAGR